MVSVAWIGLLCVSTAGEVGASRAWVDGDGVMHVTGVFEDAHGAEFFGGEAPPLMVLRGDRPKTKRAKRHSRFDRFFRRAADHYRLPYAYLKAIAKVESNFNPRATSRANARGLMQLIDPTAREMKVEDPYDPRQSIFGGARYLRILANMFEGDLVLTTAAYNAGPRRVKRAQGVPRISETRRYVKRVKEEFQRFRAEERARGR